MTDREALIAAIAASPADDLPRLVFADWLDDHGDPAQAEFIRAHVRLYRTRPGTGEHAAIARRVKELFLKHDREWCGPVYRLLCGRRPPNMYDPPKWLQRTLGIASAGVLKDWRMSNDVARFDGRDISIIQSRQYETGLPKSEGFSLSRGLVTSVSSAPTALWKIHLVEAFANAPISHLCLMLRTRVRHSTESSEDSQRVPEWHEFDGPHFSRLTTLQLHSGAYNAEFATDMAGYRSIFTSPYLLSLRALEIGPHAAHPEPGLIVSALATSPLVNQLRVLRLPYVPSVFHSLATLSRDNTVEELCPGVSPQLNDMEWAILPAIPLRETLRRLSLKACHLTDDAMLAITRVRRWDKLTHLRLDQNQIADRGIAGMCRTCVFPEVRFLNLADNQIGDLGAVAIARSGLAQTVRFLDLTKNRLTATGAIPLAAALAEGPLELLKLSARPLGRRTVRRVSEMLGRRVRFE
jgi:uncharacterized protein (TIGR02996 family)